MLVTLSDIIKLVNPELWKTPSPMLVTLEGMVTEDKLEQRVKA